MGAGAKGQLIEPTTDYSNSFNSGVGRVEFFACLEKHGVNDGMIYVGMCEVGIITSYTFYCKV